MNFIIYYPDSMRAESLSIYGNSNLKSPNFERMAKEGVVFDNAFVQNPVCTPSRISMMTGRYVHNDGHRTLFHSIRPHEQSLLTYLKEAGYEIGWFGKNDLYCRELVKELKVQEDAEPAAVKSNHRFECDEDGFYSFLDLPSYEGLPEKSATEVQKAISFIRKMNEENKPFCAFIPIGMPHVPFYAPEAFHHMYDGIDLGPLKPLPEQPRPLFYDLIKEYRGLERLPENAFVQMQKIYSGMVAFSDMLLGQLLDVVEELGISETTSVFATSDHGEFGGDYGLPEKWPNAMTDNLVHVPFVVKTPFGLKGHRVKGPVECFDLMATVLEMAGIEPRHTHFAESLVPHLKGDTDDLERCVYCEGGYDPHELHAYEGYEGRGGKLLDPRTIYYPKAKQQQEHRNSVCRSTMIRNMNYKLIRRTRDINELYDLKKDPMETRNCYNDPAYRETVQTLESTMLDWYMRTSDTVPFDDDPRGFDYS